ncbi:hypothetical protein MPAR168_06610 [Methylorubrum populi]|uniref:Antitoxin-like ribbon-helix-helix domain-containing protein n=1 Tax=Methylobacterium radiotolerans TaxID=31998 RepID=A0ABU7TFV1_9HYPH|nr:ribbon-helix-helix domain-containing protein [Methylobacterium sp. B4]PXW56892.1 hypothetical protein BY998_11518 [Methylobacterium sp. B4]
MPRPPKLDLASIVASANPPQTKRGGVRRAAARSAKPVEAEVVRLDPASPAQDPGRGATLKERAKQMSVYLEPPVYDQLRDLAYAERTKMHALMLEALDLLFERRGARSIDQILSEPRR